MSAFWIWERRRQWRWRSRAASAEGMGERRDHTLQPTALGVRVLFLFGFASPMSLAFDRRFPPGRVDEGIAKNVNNEVGVDIDEHKMRSDEPILEFLG